MKVNRFVLLNIWRTKTRSVLTMTGIAVGSFAVALINHISAAGAGEVSGILDNMGINTVLVQAKQTMQSAHLGEEDLISLTAVKGVDRAMPLMSSTSKLELLKTEQTCMIWGVNEEARDIISLSALHGRLISERDVNSESLVCVIDEDIARKTYGRSNIVGKKLKLLIGGKYREFEIIGVASSGMSALQAALAGIIPDFVYIPFSTMQNLTGRETYDKIAVLLHSDAADGVTRSIETKLSTSMSSQSGELIASNLLAQKGQLRGILGMVTFVLSVIAGISLFVAGLTVMTTMLVSVGERTREIGIKKSVGARNLDIMREFLTESALLSLMGSVSGCLAALAIAYTGCILLEVAFVFSFSKFLMPIGFSLLFGIMFGVYPALKAAGMKPIDALRM